MHSEIHIVWRGPEGHPLLLVSLTPRPLSNKLDNILLVLLHSSRLKHEYTMMWCYLGQLSLSGRIRCGVIRLPWVPSRFLLSVARKSTISQPVYAWNVGRTHDLHMTSDIAINHTRMYHRWCTISNATLRPEFRCIDSDRGSLRQRRGSHRDQHYEPGISVSLPWMHNHHAQTVIYQLPYDCKEQEDLHHGCLSCGHFIWHVVITCLYVFAWFHNMHAKECKWDFFISVFTEKFAPNVWYTHSQQPFADSLASLGLG